MFKSLFDRRQNDSPGAEDQKSLRTPEELLRKIRRIDIVSNRMADNVFSGQYRSAFRGQGIEFDEVREYSEGDDVRAIDWNVTARSNKPYVKRFTEERERTIFFMLDVSASTLFGSKTSRVETATEIAASLMFSALKNNDRAGLLTFAGGVRQFFPPEKGRNHILRLIREMLVASPVNESTNLNEALEYVNKTLKRRAVVFVISDFYVPQLSSSLEYCSRRHDVIAISITEPLERSFPDLGFVSLRDPETGAIIELDSGSKRVRQELEKTLARRRANVENQLKKAHVDLISVENGADFTLPLRTFFQKRERR